MPNLLFISHRFPYPPDRGERIRAWNLLRHMAKTYRIFLGAISDDPRDAEHEAPLRAICAELARFPVDKRAQKLRAMLRWRPGRPLMLDYYGSPGLQAWVDGVLARERIDVVYIFSTAMAPYALRDAASPAGPRRILDMQDIDSEKWTQYAAQSGWPARLVWAREGRTLLAYERRAAAACEHTMFVTQAECRRFAELAPETSARIGWLEQGVDLDSFSPDLPLDNPYPDAGPWLSFTGNMDYWPNEDAAIWFAREILPLLRVRDPAPRFAVIGANPSPAVRQLAELPGVMVTGRVADVRPYVRHADVSVAPLRLARGVQNKVLEAMALGRPVVATPGAFEGIRATAGADLLVADGAAALAATVGEVLDGRHPALGQTARRTIEAGYGWPVILRKLDATLEGVPG